MQRDVLFLLKPGFHDPDLPEQDFYCWHCALMEGVLASFPEIRPDLDVRRIGFARPREDVIALIGAENQSLPVLVLADDAPDDLAVAVYQGRRFVNEPMAILDVLHRRHGFPPAHP
ncbi:MAG: hypothetical protein CVT79_14690 [Alphaproteobacteria bacterium HGW-Alphaproteobacteria-18]|nr:MAG: hypothetical protein CVT79_14690 [Alphaproteobacteria bacterium HGW-Alphaproteobacteria-18]